MHVQSLKLVNFRSHERSTLDFAPGLNLLHGPNGAGKTNILDALYYSCLGKSFITSSDQYSVRTGADLFEVEATFGFENRSDRTVRLAFSPSLGKRLFVNGVVQERLVDTVGQFPVVAISPGDHRLTDGGPDERRRFLDSILCQESPVYLDSLLRYRRALRQRNELLGWRRYGRQRPSADALKPWDAVLANQGARVTVRRWEFLERFGEYLQAAFEELGGRYERPTIRYRAFTELGAEPTLESTERQFHEELAARADQERERGSTLIGPHRDELVFSLNDLEVRRYASQGQHRTFVLSLRLGQYRFLKDRLGERPLLLMDDVFDNLDPERIRIFSSILSSETSGQSILTAARDDVLGTDSPAARAGFRSIRVQDGTVLAPPDSSETDPPGTPSSEVDSTPTSHTDNSTATP
jgi:DNA replication and repair protein RecF